MTNVHCYIGHTRTHWLVFDQGNFTLYVKIKNL